MCGVNYSENEAHLFEHLIFYFMLKSVLPNDGFSWSKPEIDAVRKCFEQKKNLGHEFAPLLVDFLRIVMRYRGSDHED
jgi:hypothetical protein